MGWIKEKYELDGRRPAAVDSLWNSLRDSIGTAAVEFNQLHAKGAEVYTKDCGAQSAHCMRVEWHKDKEAISIEIYVKGDVVYVSKERDVNPVAICGITPGLPVHFVDGNKYSLDPEMVCRIALEPFLFTNSASPFPAS
jgi:hypothetical protein